MLMSSTLKDIARIGGGMVLDAGSMMSHTAIDIVSVASPRCIIIFRNPEKYMSSTLKEISLRAKCQVIFDFEA